MTESPGGRREDKSPAGFVGAARNCSPHNDASGTMSAGHHCTIYPSSQENVPVAGAFLYAGLMAGEKSAYIASADCVADLRRELFDYGLDVAGAEDRGELRLIEGEHVFFDPRGKFDPKGSARRVLQILGELGAGSNPVRLGIDMGWIGDSGSPPTGLVEYERRLNRGLRPYGRAALLCAYPRSSMSEVDAWNLLGEHPSLLLEDRVWRNPLYGAGRGWESTPATEGDSASDDAGEEHYPSDDFWIGILRDSPQPIAILRGDGTPLLCNQSLRRLTGCTDSPEDAETIRLFDDVLAELEESDSAMFDRDLTRDSGEAESIRILAYRAFGSGEYSTRIFVFVNDISREHRVERALRRERDVTARLMDASPAGITVVDTDGVISFANSQAEEILGLERSLIRERRYDTPDWESTDFSGAAIPDEERIFRRVMRTGKPVFGFEERIRRPDGTSADLRINGAPLRSDDGEIEGVVFVLHDVTATRRAEEYRRRKVEFLSRLASCETLRSAAELTMEEVLEVSGMEAGAIRLARDEDYPYYVHRGFSPSFVRSESHLASLDSEGVPVRDDSGDLMLECTCGRILRGEVAALEGDFTPGGSFYTGAADERLAEEVKNDESGVGEYRGRCVQEGYRSVALIPLNVGNEMIGLIQLNDRSRDALEPEILEYIEDIATPVAYTLRLMNSQQSLRLSENKYRNLVERASDAIVIVQDYIVRFANPRVEDLLGYGPEEMVGTEFMRYVHYEDVPEVAQKYNRRMTGGDEAPIYQARLRHKDGREIFTEINAGLVQFEGRLADLVLIRDISERVKSRQRLQYLSMHDQLTGLYNRAYFETELRRLDVDRQLPLTLVMGDVNGLKLINDAFGHRTGDMLLREVARMLRRYFREEDVAARWGGDEFIVILPQTDRETAESICDRLRGAFDESRIAGVELSVALGAATKEDLAEEVESILRLAEERMYRSKTRDGRSVRGSILESLQRSLRETGCETEEHSSRVGQLSLAVAERVGIREEEREELVLLADLHDIGKIALPPNLLAKPGPLGEEEWRTVKNHPVVGYRIAQSSPDLWPIAEAILTHHEWWDGSGYPRGLSGREIPLNARILAIADAYDVMVSDRPYSKPSSHSEAAAEIRRAAGTQFDPELVEAFLSAMEEDDLERTLYGER
ncbi:MAG: PAS domain S-box protein [Bacillota bacterium]